MGVPVEGRGQSWAETHVGARGGPLRLGCDPIGATSESVINAKNSSDVRESSKLKRFHKKILARSNLSNLAPSCG